ncbi:hypothetical protein C1A40_00905 [Tamlana carrageenivorans]|uniref:Uncharacterized protein n=1 Tax=Pseudotamlana carrageenivorans TaxID=2069432 RepID=A0A2I7SE01_9FLAO|nr:hypothetical protein C1A40_00905 [Tamlana carrageenivorans]
MIKADLTEPEFNTEGIFTVTIRRSFDFNKWVERWGENSLVLNAQSLHLIFMHLNNHHPEHVLNPNSNKLINY